MHDAGHGSVKTWWFRVVGKGNKERNIPVGDDLLDALRRYRSSQGLAPLPAIGEKLPLFLKARGKGGLTSSRHVRAMIQQVFDVAASLLIQNGHAEEADGLMACTVHWLRHTGISEEVQHRPLPHVRDGAGHSSISTTGIYVENNDLEIYESANKSGLLSKFRRTESD
jgi:integrase